MHTRVGAKALVSLARLIVAGGLMSFASMAFGQQLSCPIDQVTRWTGVDDLGGSLMWWQVDQYNLLMPGVQSKGAAEAWVNTHHPKPNMELIGGACNYRYNGNGQLRLNCCVGENGGCYHAFDFVPHCGPCDHSLTLNGGGRVDTGSFLPNQVLRISGCNGDPAANVQVTLSTEQTNPANGSHGGLRLAGSNATPLPSISATTNSVGEVRFEFVPGGIGSHRITAACSTLSTCQPASQLNVTVLGVPNSRTVQGTGEPECCVANPINVATGNKFQSELDYSASSAPLPLEFRRYYSSDVPRSGALGKQWTHTYSARVDMYEGGGNAFARITRPDGKQLSFSRDNPTGNWLATDDVTYKLERLFTSGQPFGWRIVTPKNVIESYDVNGRLTQLTHRGGFSQQLGYDVTAELTTVTDSFGRTLTFEYTTLADGIRVIGALIDPASKRYEYEYNASGMLEFVTYPDDTVRQYHYTKPGQPTALTGITDENGALFATWDYDSYGRAVSGAHGSVDTFSLVYNTDGSVQVTDPLGKQRTYGFALNRGVYRINALSAATAGNSAAANTRDANGFVTSSTDFNGNVTSYTRNDRGLEESRTDAYGSALQRTITTQWHADYRQPTQVDEPGRRTTATYFSSGLRKSETVLDTVTLESRTTAWTYNGYGQVETVNGPRTDVADVTTYAYYNANSLNGDFRIGDLHTVTNAEGHVTEFARYDPHGNPLEIKDPNGVVTTLTYDFRQRVKTRTTDGKTTHFHYDGVGQLTTVIRPDDSFLKYTYDAAHRLTDIEDRAGNKIHYVLDAAGNRTSEETLDPFGALKRKQGQVFDILGRLQYIEDSDDQTISEFGYDPQGNRTTQIEPGALTTTFVPDELNRTKRVDDAAGGQTHYEYDALDQLVAVIDPEGLTTSYTINALGDMTVLDSPDTDETTNVFDDAGNRIAQTDNRDVTVNFSYDKLNRLTFVDREGTSEDVIYTYDSAVDGNYGIGRLTSIQDGAGTTSLKYNKRGNLVEEKRVTPPGDTYTTKYTYDDADRVATITYPSGRVVSYDRNDNGQVTKVATAVGVSSHNVATNITYMPFGGVAGYTLGNNVTVSRTYNEDYRITHIDDVGMQSIQQLVLGYDLRGNVASRKVGSVTETLGYDALSRLESSTGGGYGAQGFTYDGVGNRLTQTGASPATYTYEPNSHRLATAGVVNFSYDAIGNVETVGSLNLTYNLANRLVNVSGGVATVSNHFNAAGQRVKKSAGGVDTQFFYDRQGQLLAEEFSGDQRLRREYIWLEGLPLALESVRIIPDVIVDNGGAGFSTVGLWTTETVSDAYGSSYAKRGPAMEVPGESIVDDRDSGASFTGTWLPGGGMDCTGLLCPPLLDSFVSNEPAYNSTFFRSDTAGPSVFTWQAALSAGRYRVYVRWVPLSGSGLATYSVTHAGGTASHPVDQALSSNGWYALGSYEFGSIAQITLAPEPGVVAVADAVRLVAIENTDSDVARWAATGEAGEYEVFARWPSVAGASSHAPYSIAHANGTGSLSQDQTANAGQWNLFGTFTFDDSATQGVSLGAVWDQTVLADAILFKPVTSAATRRELAFFHVDHLNTPQKMTDTSQAVVWEASYEPFGEATVTAQPHFDNPLRFPGQYFDAETGLHQNRHRDYDPSTGRYLQSDPVGLRGGLSTYGYALQNPLKYFDPDGLEVRFICRNLAGMASQTGYQHCFVYVRCEKENWQHVLSLFGDDATSISNPAGGAWPRKGYKAMDRADRDNPNAKNAFDKPMPDFQCSTDSCDYEKAVLKKFNAFPMTDVPYNGFGPNSNSFARDLATGTEFGGQLPQGAPGPDVAPGIDMHHPDFP